MQEQIERIRQKVGVLLKQSQGLRRENEKLLRENAQLRSQEKGYLETINHLTRQVEALQVTATDLSDSDKKVMEKKIGAYIKEIDRCITLLSE
jgi:uncharacterized protein YoxC